jgi:hypothetical protein
MPANGQHGAQIIGHHHRKRCVAARTAQDLWAVYEPDHGIVTGASDGPVVQNEDVGDILQTIKGLVVVDRNRLAREDFRSSQQAEMDDAPSADGEGANTAA